MNKISFFSGIAIVTAVLGLGMAIPVLAAGTDSVDSTSPLAEVSGQTLTPSSQLIAYQRCYYKQVRHPAYYTRQGNGRRGVFHKAYYTRERVCS